MGSGRTNRIAQTSKLSCTCELELKVNRVECLLKDGLNFSAVSLVPDVPGVADCTTVVITSVEQRDIPRRINPEDVSCGPRHQKDHEREAVKRHHHSIPNRESWFCKTCRRGSNWIPRPMYCGGTPSAAALVAASAASAPSIQASMMLPVRSQVSFRTSKTRTSLSRSSDLTKRARRGVGLGSMCFRTCSEGLRK
jgi:hypothetical protein